MLTKQELEKKYRSCTQSRWKWMRETYRLETYEFSDELMDIDYLTYLGLWCNRLNGKAGCDKFTVIRNWDIDHWEVTLVEIGGVDEAPNPAL